MSNNTEIENLICGGTIFTTIDLSNLKNLEGFDCTYSALTSIDLTNNKNLKALEVPGTLFRGINLTSNANLRYFIGYQQHHFINLDLSSCKKLEVCYTFECPNLKTICVDKIPDPADEKWKTNEWTKYITCR